MKNLFLVLSALVLSGTVMAECPPDNPNCFPVAKTPVAKPEADKTVVAPKEETLRLGDCEPHDRHCRPSEEKKNTEGREEDV